VSQVHLDRLEQRRRWLTERIKAKEIVGWETVYDTSERDALAWALRVIAALYEDAGKVR
jgi:hypothetical protein